MCVSSWKGVIHSRCVRISQEISDDVIQSYINLSTIMFNGNIICSDIFSINKSQHTALANHQFHQLHMSSLDSCAIVFIRCTLLHLLSSCTSYRQPSSLWSTSRLLRAIPVTVCWSGCLCLRARCSPPGCNLCIRHDNGLFPLCMNTAAAAPATLHPTMILSLKA